MKEYEEAFYIYEELGATGRRTGPIWVGQAASKMHTQEFGSAEAFLEEAKSQVLLIFLGKKPRRVWKFHAIFSFVP
jgi:hypothetical protein